MRKYPVCSKCGHILNPNLEDDCEKYYLIDGEIYCKFCFEEWIEYKVKDDPDEIAGLLNIPMIYVEGAS